MSYVDAILDQKADKIHVIERTPDGRRVYREYPTNYTFYYADPKGKFRSIYGDSLSRFSTRTRSEFEKERRIHAKKKMFESDINVVFRCLSDNYLNCEAPKLHTCYFDIESDFSQERGFAPTDDPFNAVTAISLYLDWLDQLVTLVMPPKHMSDETAHELTKDFENCLLFRSEIEMFETFFALIEDADVLTGWNSEGYDIPYMVNRTIKIMSKDDTRKFCLLGQLPKVRTYERYGKEEKTYDLVGRIHMDYLQLYKKYNYESRHSYSLDAIGEYEECGSKVAYEGNLDQLYNKDFKKFVEYNRQDVMLMVKINNKLKFLDLANALAHENTVLLPTVMGSVAMIEMAIYNEAHARGLVVPDKRFSQESDEQQAAGAYVADPKKGLHEWVGAVDINSLYPSAIRALNMAPETIVGQVRQSATDAFLREKSLRLAKEKRKKKSGEDADAVLGAVLWENQFGSLEYISIMNQERGTILTIDYEDGRSVEMSAAEIWKMIFDSNRPLMLSANGTIFTYEREGVIPGLLSRWYSERKSIQKQASNAYGTDQYEYYDKRQLVRKILLNSAYGALLNEHCRFYDKRIGQSVTLSGRQIVKHMMSYINEVITGKYAHDGDTIVYGDSVTGDSLIRTSDGDKTIEELFNECLEHSSIGEKEYGVWNEASVLGFNSYEMEPVAAKINYVMRHKTKKKLYRITTENGKQVTVTEDHSIMVDRDGALIECKPTDIQREDGIITFVTDNAYSFMKYQMDAEWTTVTKIECLGEVDDYVYDISIQDQDPFFFANDILVHNTDSAYFTAYPTLKPQIELGELAWSKETCIELYDEIADQVNQSFPGFMEKAFHCPRKNGSIIKAGRELIGDRALFISKKRYAVNVFDKEGKRKDTGGKAGDVKVTGLDLKRSDTPKYVQEFLMGILKMILAGEQRETVVNAIKEFKHKLAEQDPWTLGSPRSVNKLTYYGEMLKKSDTGKVNMPGHARAALNYNYLRKMNSDQHSQQIVDGMKIVVCQLRSNPLGFTSVAVPVDQLRHPAWFTELPFDTKTMEYTLVDKKIENLLGVLDWRIENDIDTNSAFTDLFSFE